ncbi:glycosyltransferase family 2 protein [Flavobacterium sp. 3HN19-14]|uniref:glycosyltransferase family 2 protein n=1 Tax=Flavobacterium sp. 3HN19-14 TaxID=3448133 RepID=UPI003EE0D58F
MIAAGLIIFFIYLFVIFGIYSGFLKVKLFEAKNNYPETRFTIIVPFRNEAGNLPSLLESLSNLNYPVDLFEVILVDDASQDGYRLQIADSRFQVVANHRTSNSPKKDAILTAIQSAKHDWIITTDADCIVPTNWLLCFDNLIRKNDAEMVAGAIVYRGNKSFLHAFQQLDIASLQAATIGGFGLNKAFMCNGANFAYTKDLFEKLGGFEGNTDFAGGDDVFLLQKAVRHFPGKVHYLKATEAIVHTKPENSWKSLFFQRVRWAKKTSGYQSVYAKLLGIVIFATNCFWILGAVWVFGFRREFPLLTFTVMKFTADYFLITSANRFLGQKTRWFLLGSFIYPFFSTAVVLYSVFGKFEWKGRKFRK